MEPKGKRWCGVQVVINKSTTGLFEMTPPNDDPDQQPTLVVTQGVADLVDQEFDLFKAQLEQTIWRWRKEKARVMGKSQKHTGSEDSDEPD